MDINNDTTGITPKKSRRAAWLWSAGTLALLAGVGVMVMTNVMPPAPLAATTPTAQEDRVMRLHPAELLTVEARDVENLVKVSGTVFPSQEAAIAAQVSGLAEAVTVRPGDHVEAGDLLIEVGTTDLQLQLDQQRATMATTQVQLDAAKTLLERTQTMVDRGLSAPTTLDSPRAEVDRLNATMTSQQTQVTLAETNLRRARVTAPFSGTVASRAIEPGQIVNPGTTMLSLVDLSEVRVEVTVAMTSIGRVAPGQSVRLRVPGMPGEEFTAVVDRISPVAESGTRSVKVHLTLDNPDGRLLGGMFVSGEIVLDSASDVLAVPADAIVTVDQTQNVMAVVDGRLRLTPIDTGTAWQGGKLVEAQSGLDAGTIIVANTMSGLSDGTSVVIEQN